MRLAIITTHPIQYYAPVFKLLAKSIDLKVFYTWGNQAAEKFDPGFGRNVSWDIPLLEGYDSCWVKNIASDPGSHHFKGIINPQLNRDIIEWKADAILVYGWAYHSHLKAIRYFKNKIPVYFRGDSTLLDARSGITAVLKSIFLRWVYSHIDHAFFVGTNNKAYFKKYGLTEQQLTFAPHAIDNERFGVDRSEEAGQLRSELGINPTDVLILFAGKLEEKKSPGLLLNAFLSLQMPGIHLLFVGNGALESDLKDTAGKKPQVHFMEFQNQSAMPVVYQACNLFCLPSKGPGETWGLAINEAMASGRPVLVSDKCGAAADLVTDQNGAIFKSGDPDELTSALKRFLTEDALSGKSGERSRAIIANWSFNRQAEAIEKIIKR